MKVRIEHNKKIFVVILVFIMLIIILACLTPREIVEGACERDEDCILQQTTCCSCNMGGQEDCMSERNASYWKEKLVEECEEKIMCIALYNCKIKECKCEEGDCVGVEEE